MKRKLLLPISFVLLLSGCLADLNLDPDMTFRYNGNWQAPIVNARLNLGNLVEQDSLATADANGLVHIIYREDSVYGLSIYDYTSVPEQDPQEATIKVGDAPFAINTNLGTFGGAKMDTIAVATGKLKWSTDVNGVSTNDTVTIRLKILNTTIAGVPIDFNLKAVGMGLTEGEINLDNLLMDLTQGTPNYNNIGFEIGLDSAQTTAPQGTEIDIVLQFEDLRIDRAIGFFGTRQINFPSGNLNTSLSLLENLSEGLYLANPQVKLYATSNVGLPIAIDADMIGVGRNGSTIDLGLDTLNYYGPATKGAYATDTFEINTSNSNIDNFIAAIPEQIVYSGSATMNPNGEGAIDNFISQDGLMNIGMEIDLPLELKTKDLTIEQTIYNIDFGVEEGNEDFVEKLTLGFKVENGFPLDADIYAYFQDSTGAILDSAVLEIFDAAQVGSNGQVVSPAQTERFLTFTQSQIDNVLASDDIRIRVVLNTSNGGNQVVQMLTDYYIDLIVGIRVKLNLEL